MWWYLSNLCGSVVCAGINLSLSAELEDGIPASQLQTSLQASPPFPKQPKLDCPPCNPLLAYPRAEYWVYADYKHMIQLCSPCPQLLAAIDWAEFGFEGRGGAVSTMWLGSEGSFTPCHYDTYGCNLVAQLWGQKRWLLYPPRVSGACKHIVRCPEWHHPTGFSQAPPNSSSL